MKKYIEIIEEINKTRESITNAAEADEQSARAAMRTAYTNGTEKELEAAKAKYKEAEARYIAETERNETAKIKIEILKDNAAQAFLHENIDIICNIWNKYEGKPHGEKTAAKIRAELKSTTGYYVYICNRYNDANINIAFSYGSGAPFQNIEFCPIWNGANQPAIDNNNKIVKLIPEHFRVYCCGEYVDDINVHIDALKKAHKAAQEAEESYKNAVNAYNELTRGKIAQANTREGVKNWLI